MGKNYRKYSKAAKNPKRPYEKENWIRIIIKRKILFKNKSKFWRVQYVLARIRKAVSELLTLEPNDPRRIFEE
jgi:small subunit ribosomal protein S9e